MNSGAPARRRSGEWGELVRALAGVAVLLAALILAVAAVRLAEDSPDSSVASGSAFDCVDHSDPSTVRWVVVVRNSDGTCSIEPFDPTPSPSPTGTAPTSTPSPSGPLVIVLATETPEPFKAPRPEPTSFPTCPADGSGVLCFYVPPEPTAPAAPTPTPVLDCDVLRAQVIEGWCEENPDE